jgi:hypothetical protein
MLEKSTNRWSTYNRASNIRQPHFHFCCKIIFSTGIKGLAAQRRSGAAVQRRSKPLAEHHQNRRFDCPVALLKKQEWL